MAKPYTKNSKLTPVIMEYLSSTNKKSINNLIIKILNMLENKITVSKMKFKKAIEKTLIKISHRKKVVISKKLMSIVINENPYFFPIVKIKIVMMRIKTQTKKIIMLKKKNLKSGKMINKCNKMMNKNKKMKLNQKMIKREIIRKAIKITKITKGIVTKTTMEENKVPIINRILIKTILRIMTKKEDIMDMKLSKIKDKIMSSIKDIKKNKVMLKFKFKIKKIMIKYLINKNQI